MSKPEFSANFKKDYIAYSAIAIFFLILSFEIFMAVFIPAHLHMEGVWSKEVARQQMIAGFDVTRRWFLRFKSKNDDAEAESDMFAESMSPLADYLRQYQYQLGFEEIKSINDAVNGLNKYQNHLGATGAYSVKLKINSDKFINILEKDLSERP